MYITTGDDANDAEIADLTAQYAGPASGQPTYQAATATPPKPKATSLTPWLIGGGVVLAFLLMKRG